MATRNAERYLGPLLESLARQTRAPAELVVHDDASEDGTVAMLEAFAARAPFPRGGGGAAGGGGSGARGGRWPRSVRPQGPACCPASTEARSRAGSKARDG